jgi:hypothetical protein
VVSGLLHALADFCQVVCQVVPDQAVSPFSHFSGDDTISTLPACAWDTTVPTALVKGIVLMSSVRIATMSASLPGVSVPILLPSAAFCAPRTVANSSMSRTVSGAGGFGSWRTRALCAVHRCK